MNQYNNDTPMQRINDIMNMPSINKTYQNKQENKHIYNNYPAAAFKQRLTLQNWCKGGGNPKQNPLQNPAQLGWNHSKEAKELTLTPGLNKWRYEYSLKMMTGGDDRWWKWWWFHVREHLFTENASPNPGKTNHSVASQNITEVLILTDRRSWVSLAVLRLRWKS